METKDALIGFAALSQEMRLDVIRRLIAAEPAGLTAGELAQAVGALPNTLSANLTVLAQAGLVRSLREGRQIRYFARIDTVQALIDFLMRGCCGGQTALCVPANPQPLQTQVPMTEQPPSHRPFNVLFLCTRNSARSIIAEAILNDDRSGRFRAYSAGADPADAPHPRTLQLLQRLGYPTDAIRSKSWDEFAAPDAPEMDFVFTVCDKAAAETCPVWIGHPVSAHWGVPDPAIVTGNEAEQATAFNEAHRALKARIDAFRALPIETLARKSLKSELDKIGRSDV